jgi:ligand-binding sensor domain-containing protein
MKNLLTILCCFFLLNLTAQDWKTFTNHKKVLDIQKEGNTLWIATSGGLLNWNLQTEAYYKLTTEDGLISNHINEIAIDAEGRKWLATRRGVSVIDGVNITSYNSDNGLYANDVNSVVIDSQGNKWFAVNGNFGLSAVSRIDSQGNWWTIPESIDFAPTCLAVDSSDNIYIGKNYQIAKYTSAGNWVAFSPQSSTDNIGYVVDALVDENQNLWAISSSGLFHIDVDGNKTKFDESDGFDNFPNSLYQDGNGTLWVGTHDGITKVNSDTTFTNLSLPEPVNAIFESDENIWLGTPNDVSLFDGTTTTGKLSTEIDLVGNLVRGLDISNDGSVWMGTEKGISKYASNSSWTQFNKSDGLACNIGFSLMATSNDEIIISHSTNCNGVSFIDINTGEASFLQNDTFHFTLSLNEDLNENIWLGYYAPPIFDSKYAAKVSPNGDIKFYDFTTVLSNTSNNKTTGIANHPNGDVYFSTRWGIYYVDTNDELHLFKMESASTIFIDNQENIWIGEGDYFAPNHSLEKFTPTGDHIVYQNSEINDFPINEIIEDDQQNIWIATGNGLFKLTPDSVFTRYSTLDGLADDNVTGIEFDANGEMWISTWNGVSTTADISTAISNVENKKVTLQLYPNPILTTATLDFDLEKNENVRVEIFNVAGQLLLTPFDGKRLTGNHQLEFNVASFPQGIYFCKIKIGGQSEVLKFVKM